MSRNPLEIMDQIITLIPDGEWLKTELVEQRNWLAVNAKYWAPEQMHNVWAMMAGSINTVIYQQYDELIGWKKRVIDVFTDRKGS